MSELFREFDPLSTKAWKQKIQADLKGADYNEHLIWNTEEGIDVLPFYHRDMNIRSGAIIAQEKKFQICQSIDLKAEESSEGFSNRLQKGIDGVHIRISNGANIDPVAFLKHDALSDLNVYFDFKEISPSLAENLTSISDTSKLALNIDPIGKLVRSGNWYVDNATDHQVIETLIESGLNFKSILAVDACIYQNAGATAIQQLAYALSHVFPYVKFIKGKTNLPVVFKVAIGHNYFMEIAKLRAIRVLWKSLTGQFDYLGECIIQAFPSKRNKTIFDFNNNMLRTTSECMSAILGGADAVCNLPYDSIYHHSNEFAERIAVNQLLILRHESLMDKVSDSANGAYYIERLTAELAERALGLFKDIDKNGGFLTQLKEGTIQRKIRESANKEQELFDQSDRILVGTNKYPNHDERMRHELDVSPFLKVDKRQTIMEPIIEKRLAEKNEKERIANE